MWVKPKEFIKNKKFSISKNYFEYTNFDNVHDIINTINNKGSEVNFNELICKNDLVKPYFDIESNIEFDIFKIVNTIKKVFHDLYTVKLTDSEIYILECNRIVKETLKYSYHIIIDNYHFLDKTQAKFAAMDLHDYHHEIDLSVYSDGYQNIRMLNCVKKGENVPFKLVNKEYSDEIFAKCLITNVNKDSICIEFVLENGVVLSEKEFLCIIPLIEKDLGTKIINIKECKNYITFNYNHDYKCLFGEQHSQLGHCVNKYEETFSVTCFSSKCKGKKLYSNITKHDNLLKELSTISENSVVKKYDIKHVEITKKNKTCIEALIETPEQLNDIHDFNNENCNQISLYAKCDKHGYKITCCNCVFKYPKNSIPLNELLTPQIFNILINAQEDINNKDTSQVAEKLLTYMNLIYTDDKKWYLYNEESGIYENKSDGFVLGLIKTIANKMKENDIEEDWHNWINKVGYKENLLRELKIECLKENIKLDDNKFLLGFPNGVVDLKTNIFRRGQINEYITMKCGFEYSKEIDTSLALKYLSDVFPDKEERDYTVNKFSLILEGYNREQMIAFSYGYTASNGKSYTMDRIRDAMGDYAGTFPVTLLTNKMKGAGEANSSLIKFNNKRFMYCSEPEANSKLNTNFVKVLTGDKITARAVYAEKEIEMYPSYKIFICCNTLPDFDTYDEGIARRISLTEYKTKFCENPKRKNERLLKKYSDEDDKRLSHSLLKLLIENYALLRNNEYKYLIPKDIQSMQNMYLDDNKNVIRDILVETYEIGSDNDYVKNKDIKSLLERNDIKKDINTVKKIVQDIFPDAEFKIDGKIDGDRVRNVFCKLFLKNA